MDRRVGGWGRKQSRMRVWSVVVWVYGCFGMAGVYGLFGVAKLLVMR